MDTTLPAVEGRLSAFRERCAGLELALTPQRLAIYQVLAGDDSHPTAEDIYRRVKPGMPSLSLGTVYRTLEVFESNGLVTRVHAPGDQARFDANLDAHHHLVCTRCQRVIDFEDPRLQKLPAHDALPDGFLVTSHHINFLGLCQDCQAAR